MKAFAVLFLFALLGTPAPRIELNALLEPAVMEPDEVLVYKKEGGRELHLYLFRPEATVSAPTAALLAIHGGGWKNGMPLMFFPHARYFAMRGMTAFSVEYRLIDTNAGTTIFDSIADCNDAVVYVRTHAAELGIDPDRIAVIGDSSGAHLAACTGTLPIPGNRADAVINCNGIMDMTGSWIGFVPGRSNELAVAVSPLFNVSSNSAPMLHLHSPVDTTVDPAQAAAMHSALTNAGVRSELYWVEGAQHAFILSGYTATQQQIVEGISETDRFLESLGYLSGTPSIAVSAITNPPPAVLLQQAAVNALPVELDLTAPSVTIGMEFKISAMEGSLTARKSFLGFSKRGCDLRFQSGNRLRMAAFGADQTLANDISTNEWHSLVLSVGNGSASLLIDGNTVALDAVTFADPQEGRTLLIGNGLAGEIRNLTVSIP